LVTGVIIDWQHSKFLEVSSSGAHYSIANVDFCDPGREYKIKLRVPFLEILVDVYGFANEHSLIEEYIKNPDFSKRLFKINLDGEVTVKVYQKSRDLYNLVAITEYVSTEKKKDDLLSPILNQNAVSKGDLSQSNVNMS